MPKQRRMPIILDLCGGSGAWSRPYRDAGYEVVIVDYETNLDVKSYEPPSHVWGVLAAPPCTEFSGSGARWWADKEPHLLKYAIEVVKSCLSIVERTNPTWWALENPVGRLARCVLELGRWNYTYQPWEFGDTYTKKTCMWGKHTRPMPTAPVMPLDGSKTHRYSPSPQRAALRGLTPAGFAKAFFEANP